MTSTSDAPGARTTADHHVRIRGRSWRATDPAIPDALRSELVDELMSARRAVGSARRSSDTDAERAARQRVQDAKVALGERGHPWWEPPKDSATYERLTSTILALCRHRGPGRTICPSDAARVVGADGWRDIMDDARHAAVELADVGRVQILARGEPVPRSEPLRGPVRIRLAVGTEER